MRTTTRTIVNLVNELAAVEGRPHRPNLSLGCYAIDERKGDHGAQEHVFLASSMGELATCLRGRLAGGRAAQAAVSGDLNRIIRDQAGVNGKADRLRAPVGTLDDLGGSAAVAPSIWQDIAITTRNQGEP